MSLDTRFADLMRQSGPFETNPIIAVALSGGADSMALVMLAHRWAQGNAGSVVALTVDHRIRPESTAEAAQVANWMKSHGIEHHILTWEHPPLHTGIPNAAREARYALLSNWCRSRHILHLLIGHHADDQAETVSLRNARKSGVTGLSGMAAVSVREGVRILRPLLVCDKSELVNFLISIGKRWIEDPSNAKPISDRNRLRHDPDFLQQKDDLYALADASCMDRIALEKKLCQHMVRDVRLYPEGWALWQYAGMEHPDEAILIARALAHTIGGGDSPPRYQEAAHAWQLLRNGSGRSFTLGGALFKLLAGGIVRVERESGRIKHILPLNCEHSMWDNRFSVLLRSPAPQYRLEMLGYEGLRSIEAHLPASIKRAIPRSIISTLPAVKGLEGVLEVPHITYRKANHPSTGLVLQWKPGRPLSSLPFMRMGKVV